MFRFPPKKTPSVERLLANKELLRDLTDCYGSPCDVLLPENIDENVKNFRDAMAQNNVAGKVFFAHKCNKSAAVLKQMRKNGVCIDVASAGELKSALVNGFTGAVIEATGPKNDDFILLGLQHGILFNADSVQELETIALYRKRLGIKKPVRVLTRLNGFHSNATKIINKVSRFGVPAAEFPAVLSFMAAHRDDFDWRGLSFHLDTVNITEKVIAIENCVGFFEQMFDAGFDPSVLNIGGGFKVNYIAGKKDWNESISDLKEDIMSGKGALSWNGKTFGLSVRDNTLHGALNIYNYYDELVGEKFLNEMLQTPLAKYQNRKIADILSENMIELYIEPGRSLLDNAGVNLARVSFVKTDAKGDTLVGVDMKRSDLLIGEQEMFVDPVLISDASSPSDEGVFFVGNLCMENDMIFNRKVFLGAVPQKGDVVAFVNTAGYFMDFEQSKTLGQNVAEKVVLKQTQGGYKQYLDKNYNPFRE